MFIDDGHWPTDGEWKESVLRSIIRRSAPDSVTIGRGFVVAPDWQSTQIDVLIYDNTFPVLYRDGDLVFVSPASCRAIIEVKSAIRSAVQFRDAAAKLAACAENIREATQQDLFVGLFAYESHIKVGPNELGLLQESAGQNCRRIINHVVLGPSDFIKFWRQRPENGAAMYNHWHLYQLTNMAAGYFVHNLIGAVCSDLAAQREDVWFPRNSKEAYLAHQCQFATSQ